MSADEQRKVISLRLPPDLHSVLVAMADTERRSLNAQIVYMLQRATTSRDK